jgi:hypothetical protein
LKELRGSELGYSGIRGRKAARRATGIHPTRIDTAATEIVIEAKGLKEGRGSERRGEPTPGPVLPFCVSCALADGRST